MGSVSDDQASAKSAEELPGSRIKFLCSHGGKILPKADGQLRYVGGDTRLVSVKKTISFLELMSKLEKLFGPNLWLKYQLPSEDLDALISVSCDEDVENMIEEYDRNEARDGASRLRAFLFPRVGMPSRGAGSSSDQLLDEAKSPRGSSEHLYYENINGPRAQSKMRSDSSAGAFQVPDFLFGFDSGSHPVSHHHQQQQDGDSFSPKHPHTFIDKSPSLLPSVPPVKVPPPMVLQGDYAGQQDFSGQQASKIDSGGRGPALTTSALGPLISNNQHMWENQKVWDVGAPGDQKDERRATELNGESNYTEPSITRIPSKDRMYMEVPHADTFGRVQPILHMEKLKLEDLHTDVPSVLSNARQEIPVQGGARLHKPPEMQRVPPQMTPGVSAAEMQWVLPQPNVAGFDVVADRSAEKLRNSGDSDEAMHMRMEGQLIVENAAHPRPIVTTTEGPPDGFKFQDAAYRGEETMVLQQQQQQRQGEFEVSAPLHAQVDAAQHFHHLGKGHFQQVYWQLRDPQEQQQQQTSLHEPVRAAHSASSMQRHVQPSNFHIPSSGAVVHHILVPAPPSNVRAMPRSDTLPNTRLPSPLYRQVAMAGTLRSEPQQVSRALSPLREHPAANAPLTSNRYGHRAPQVHDAGYFPSAIRQQSSGLSVPQVYMEPVEAHSCYDQNAGQSHYTEKGTLVNHDVAIAQLQYSDKVMMANQDAAMGQLHYSDDTLQTSQYMRVSNQDTQGVPLH